MGKKSMTDAERTLRSRLKLNRVQVLFKKEHRAQIRILAMRKKKTFVQFLEDEMERIIQEAKRKGGPEVQVLLDKARDTALQSVDQRERTLTRDGRRGRRILADIKTRHLPE